MEKKYYYEIIKNIAENEKIEDLINESLFIFSNTIKDLINENIITFHHNTFQEVLTQNKSTHIFITLCHSTYYLNKKRIIRKYKETKDYSMLECILIELIRATSEFLITNTKT